VSHATDGRHAPIGCLREGDRAELGEGERERSRDECALHDVLLHGTDAIDAMEHTFVPTALEIGRIVRSGTIRRRAQIVASTTAATGPFNSSATVALRPPGDWADEKFQEWDWLSKPIPEKLLRPSVRASTIKGE